MKKITKTNAMRILDASNISYDYFIYDTTDGKIDGMSVAKKTGQDPEIVFKTLVFIGASKEIYIFCIPVMYELNLKKASKAVNEKSIEILQQKDLTKYTGYARGGCSPIGMKKLYKTYIDESAYLSENIIVSAGCIGMQIIINPNDLLSIVNGVYEDLI